MAENKKSFIAYSDWKETFDKLPNEIAGKLIKHIFAYVNDENPISDDFVIEAVFANIKNTLKRDLDKWENQLQQRSEAGRKSAEQRKATKSNDRSISLNETTRNSTDSVSVSVSDSVNVNEEIIKDKSFNYKTFLNDLICDEDLVNDYMKVRKTKKASNTKTAFDGLVNYCTENNFDLHEAIKIMVENSWVGFKIEWVENLKPKKTNQTPQREPTRGGVPLTELIKLDKLI